MENYFDKEFELRYFEMNKLGEASPITMLTLLQETAAEHCYSAGHSLLSLIEPQEKLLEKLFYKRCFGLKFYLNY